MITERPLTEIGPKMPPRAVVIEPPEIRQWGPLFRARYPNAGDPRTEWMLVLVIPFTRTRASIQFKLVVYDRP